MAANVSVPNTFSNGIAADAPAVNADFAALVTWINTNAVHLDGSKPMAGHLSGPATDPVSANQYSRKSYVDAQNAATLASANATATTLATNAVTTALARKGAQAGRNGSVYSTPNGGSNFVIFDTEFWDSSTYFAGAGNTDVVIPVGEGGVYVISGFWISTGVVAGHATSNLRVSVQNGGVDTVPCLYSLNTTGGNDLWTGCGIAALSAGAVLKMKITNLSATTLNGLGSMTIAKLSI